MNSKEKLSALRKLMNKHNIDAYIIPMTDAHLSEYVANHWRVINWISGFSGSAGTIVVTQNFAGLWTDSRYFIQAENQLKNSGFELVKLKIPHTPEYIEWLNKELKVGETVAFDAKVFPVGLIQIMESVFNRKSIKINGSLDFIETLWTDRPEIPKNKIFIHDIKYAGKSSNEKIKELNEKMNEQSIDYHILSSLDDIAWLFNIRGNDIDYNPLAISYALVSSDKATLYIDKEKLTESVNKELITNNISIKPYTQIYSDLSNLENGKTVFTQLSKTNYALYNSIPKECFIIDDINITSIMKAEKNQTEISHIRETMIKDGAAMVKFLYWIEKNVGKEKITEISASEKLRNFRAEQEGFFGESFGTISAYKSHGAMPHYSATKESDVELKPEGLYLVDSGGQYFGGTTDITRTVTLGKLTDEEKRDFTLALKGTINLAMAVFPYGTKGVQLDAFARKPLWDNHMNYGHGTGHGVGFFLNVHEGPQSISTNSTINKATVLQVGMLTSDEPAFYRKDKHGIRIENLILVVEDKENEFGKFLKFETVTLCPIDTKPVDVNLLTFEEKKWLNDYHKDVYDKISPFLDEEYKKLLKEKTKFV
ncbi:MAG: aminopeptidase P family protein [Bacteroidales bacterium]|nr:aminopeptidase P family protein [Bacteroidales bacterium]MBN2755925.1 aminopeptidase P family protein [Bacteroidales bacterium]